MKPIATLTLNPTIDGACSADKVVPVQKIRTSHETYEPGGGGVNVARVINELGGQSLAIYLSGGTTGAVLDGLVDDHQIPRRTIRIERSTRVSLVVIETSTGLEYRFVPEGPRIAESEWRIVLATVKTVDADYFVASGSVPRGVPDDIYVQTGRIAATRKMRLVLDTSGEALKLSVAAGNIYLLKPSLGEFETLVSRSLPDRNDLRAEAVKLANSGKVEIVVVTLGNEGALLATRETSILLKSPPVEAKSAVGAGDSFVAAMTLALAHGRPVEESFRYGVAAGTAAVLRHGTKLCDRDDVKRLFSQLQDG